MNYFIGLPLPEAVRAQLAAVTDALPVPAARLRREPREKLHCTLLFLGPQPDDRLPAMTGLLAPAPLPAGLVLTLNGLGAFPSPARARVLWAGFTVSPALAGLQERLATAAVAAGFAVDSRPFVPHVTLARSGRTPVTLDAICGVVPATGSFPVTEVVLWRSRRGTYERCAAAGIC